MMLKFGPIEYNRVGHVSICRLSGREIYWRVGNMRLLFGIEL